MNTTIAAISTGLTPSGIIIIRMSGPESVEIADKIFKSRIKKAGRPSSFATHTLHLGYIEDRGEVLDEVLLSVMKAPRTFTGEDIVEINCHGGVLVAKRVLDLLYASGAVPAEPGEFAKRAFMNGKIDLTKAEAVADLISAKNQYALKAGAAQLKGNVSKKVKDLREILLDEISYIEAALDDPEHYDLTGYETELAGKLRPVRDSLERLLSRADFGSVVKEGIRTVIAGRPNAGKSSLLNLLSGYEKAIVTDVAGTTRDVLEEEILLGNLSLILMDTAGIRKTDDTVEKIGVGKAKDAMREADLILYLVDSTEGVTDEDREVLASVADKQVILLMNKADLLAKSAGASEKSGAAASESPAQAGSTSAAFEEAEAPETGAGANASSLRTLSFSALTGEGLESLENLILSLFDHSEIGFNDEVMITSARQKVLFREAKESIEAVLRGIDEGMPEDVLTIDLAGAYESLGKILGEEVGEDVVNRIFDKFCMGK